MMTLHLASRFDDVLSKGLFWMISRYGGRCVAVSADAAARLTGFSSGQVCLLEQAMMPATLVLMVLEGLLDSGIASHGSFFLGWQVALALKMVGAPSVVSFAVARHALGCLCSIS
jgi:hypothetical protein